MTVAPMWAQWNTLSRKTVDGKEIPAHVNNMSIYDGKLYAATPDGIWVSASKDGGDWSPYGLQGENVLLLNFGEYKLALVDVESVEYNKDGTLSTSGQIFKMNDAGDWKNTNFNKELHKNYRATSGFVQIKDQSGNNVIVVPTWGDGIWRSEDAGETWSVSDYVTDEVSLVDVCKTTVGLFTFPGDNTIYGTDKAGNEDNYLVRSTDYGKTWSIDWVGAFFNPWAFAKRSVNGVETFYFGGENGSNGFTVMSSTANGAEGTWNPCATTDEVGTYWHNRYMLGVDNGPLFVMCAATGVFLYNDADATLTKLGEDINVTRDDAKSLSHLAMTSDKLYCSSTEHFIQTYDISSLDFNGVEGVESEREGNLKFDGKSIYINADAGSLINIYTLLGNKVLSEKADANQSVISTGSLDSGLYLVEYVVNGRNKAEKLYIR